jgi:hypothetical protein
MGSLNSRDLELMDSTGLRMLQQKSLGHVGYNHGPPKRTKDYATVFKKDPENAVMTVDIQRPTPEVIERVQDDVIRLQHGVALERLQQCKNWLWVFRLYGTLKHYGKFFCYFQFKQVCLIYEYLLMFASQFV